MSSTLVTARRATVSNTSASVARRAVTNVELKGPRTAAPVVALVEDYVRNRGWQYEDFLVSCFDRKQIIEAKRLCPRLRIGVLIERVSRDVAATAGRIGAFSINPHRERVTPELVADAHRRGLKVFVYTVNEPADIARMRAMGVDGVFCDYPERCR